MIDLVRKYNETFSDSRCGIMAHDGTIFIEDNSGKLYCKPDVTKEQFEELLEESKKSGKNLFFERWDAMKPYDGIA